MTTPEFSPITGGWNASTARLGPPRLQRGPLTTALQLGPLANLVGSWSGPGFNAIWRPDNIQPPANSAIHRFLELNLTHDSFDFRVIPGAVPNRGFNTQADLDLYGLHYLQRTRDADKPPFSTAGQALHIEPGLFMNVPGSEADSNEATIVRMGSIPHGTTVLMTGPNPGAEVTQGSPTIPTMQPFNGFPGVQPFTTTEGLGIQPISIAPSNPAAVPPVVYGEEHVVPENQNTAADTAFPGSQSNGPYPAEFQNFVNDPNSVLRDAIAGQDIAGFIEINLTAPGVGQGIENIPFLGIPNMDYNAVTAAANPTSTVDTDPAVATTTPNAFVYSAQATFWIEFVKIPFAVPQVGPQVQPGAIVKAVEPFFGEPTFLQLQYSQLVILVFNNILWPHVTVATMTLSNG